MRELTVKLRFTRPCLGNTRDYKRNDGRFVFPRTVDGSVMFLASWNQQNLRLASQLLGRHQSEVDKILWDVTVDGWIHRDRWFRRYYIGRDQKRRFAFHEAFFPGQIVGLNCIVPAPITDDDFIQLMNLAGRYKGLSPWKPGEYGQFEVAKLVDRRRPAKAVDGVEEKVETMLDRKELGS